MSSVNKSELIANFASITGTDTDRAQFYLEAAAWNIDVAVASFYQEDDAEGGGGMPSAARDDPVQPPAKPSEHPKKSTQSSRFGTISALKGDESDSSDEGRQAFYAGGSERGAGQAVLGPPKKKKPDELVQDMFKSAKDHGAEEVAAGSSSDAAKKPSAFRGTGYKLGETEDSSETIAGAPMENQPRQVDMVLKLWKNGFSVDDGQLREYHDQENQDFLDAIKRGEVPRELVRMAKGGEVNLNMEDHREEEYVKPKVVLKAFSGEGNRLGSAAPTVVSYTPSSKQTKEGENAAKSSVQVDESKPTTSIQIRLADGSRLVAKLNHSHLISDIRNYIITARPQYATATFVLMTTFPNKELSDESQSIEQAKLQNAVIVQRMK